MFKINIHPCYRFHMAFRQFPPRPAFRRGHTGSSSPCPNRVSSHEAHHRNDIHPYIKQVLYKYKISIYFPHDLYHISDEIKII